jgi:hypothetical protein
MMLWLIGAAWAGACRLELVNPELTAAENAYLNGQSQELARAANRARRLMFCRPLDPTLVGRFHRVQALAHAFDNQWADAVEDFRASLIVDPLAQPSDVLLGDTRLRLAWYRAEETPIDWKTGGTHAVGGRVLGVSPNAPVWTGRSRRKPVMAATSAVFAGLAGGLLVGGLVNGKAYEQAQPLGDAEKPYLVRDQVFGNGMIGSAGLSVVFLGATFLVK